MKGFLQSFKQFFCGPEVVGLELSPVAMARIYEIIEEVGWDEETVIEIAIWYYHQKITQKQ